MDLPTGIFKALLKGFVDSVKGTVMIFYLDRNIRERADKRSRSPFSESSKNKNDATSRRHSAQSQRKHEEPRVLHRTLQCCALNGGVFGLSLALFRHGLLPLLRRPLALASPAAAAWLEPALTLTFAAVWVLPLFLLSKVVNALWFQDIADWAYRYSRGTPQQFSSLSKLVADTLFSILVQALFLAQTTAVSRLPIPWVAEALGLVHMCLLYSLYSFEYKWCHMGWELHRRLAYLERHWPYFVGFGLPLAALTALPSSYLVSGCVFSILFPLFIISGNEADPVTNVCESRLKLFSPVVAVSNALFNRTVRVRTAPTARPPLKPLYRPHSTGTTLPNDRR